MQSSLLLLLIISPIWQQRSSILSRDSAAGGIVAAFTFHSPSSTSSSSSLSITRIGQRIISSHPKDQHFKHARGALYSTPFDLDLYNDNNDDDDDSNNIDSEQEDLRPPLAAPPSTQLILGINKYSHDTTLCAADAQTSQVLFAVSKERMTRSKHDGGNIASLVETCLDVLDLDLENVVKVVMNNHHHRILPLVE
eukprot:scaffold24227_cov83-Skeletonema_dohrnii-CCMP3373.AAC.1